jgi:hypothetical protein
MMRIALCLSLAALLGSCELIANIPDRGEIVDDCSEFCQRANALCKSPFQIYKPSECPAVCRLFSREERECRMKELDLLEQGEARETGKHCAGASLSGGQSKCGGTPCENYCRTMGAVCSGDLGEDGVTYPNPDGSDAEDCIRMCSVIPDKEKRSRTAGSSTFDVIKDHEGDSVQCRLVHLSLAAQNADQARLHCNHAFVSPKAMNNGEEPPWCGSPLRENGEQDGVPDCQDYCDIVTAACVDTDDAKHAVYESAAQCMKVCEILPKGNLLNPTGDTIACRKYHSYNAVTMNDQDVHCPHAGPGGATTCGADCGGFCDLVEVGCADEFKSEYGSRRACLDACASAQAADPSYPENGSKYYNVARAKEGNNWACRLHNAVKATVDPSDSREACEHAISQDPCPAD